MNVETKEQAEKTLSAEEYEAEGISNWRALITAEKQEAVNEMLAIIRATNKDNQTEQAKKLYNLLQEHPRIINQQTRFFVKGGAQPYTPLMVAARLGHAEIVKLLIAAGAKFDKKDWDGETALMIAAQKGHEEIVRYLINHGANPNMQDINGMTPLMIAANADEINYNIVQLLVAGGANIAIKNMKDHDKTAFDYAQKPLSLASAKIDREMRYVGAIAEGRAEYEKSQKNREMQQTEIENFIPVKDLAAIVSDYGHEPLPEPEKQLSLWDKAKGFAAKFYWRNWRK